MAETEDAGKWKDKYLASVDRLKQYKETIELLQKCVVRVSLAADGQHRKLDDELSELRSMIRDDAPDADVERRLESLSQVLLDLEEEKKHHPLLDTFTELIQPLENAHLPNDLDKRLKSLSKLLKKAEKQQNVEEVVEVYTSLVRDAFKSAFGELTDADYCIDVEKPGLFKRILGKPGEAEKPPSGIEQISDSVRDTLLNLLNHLIVPNEFQTRSEKIIQDLKNGLTIDKLPETLDRIVALVVDSASEETHEFEDFLQRIAERLIELQDYLASVGVGSEHSLDETNDINSLVQSHVMTIRESISSNKDVGDLKEAIETQLTSIVDRVDTFCQSQAERHNDFKTKISALQERLEETEKESADLRENLVVQRARAQLDALTKLPNRQAYDHQLSAEYSRWQRYRKPLSLMVIDIDFFKRINDTFGHAAGDKVLKTVARVLQVNIRETDFISRYGGEEFVLIMPETNKDGGAQVAEKLRATIEKCPFHSNNQKVPVTISIGIAEFDGEDNAVTVFERADKALYAAKEGGRNQVKIDE